MNVVMTGAGRFVEVQGTAEGMPFSRGELDDLLGLAEGGIEQIVELQAEVVAEPPRSARRRADAWHRLRLVLPPPTPTRWPRSPRSSAPTFELVPRPADVPDVVEDARHARGQRPAQGGRRSPRPPASRRWPTTPGSRSTRSAARPASTRPATPGERRHLRRQRGQAAGRAGRRCPAPTRTARFRTVARRAWPDGREVVAEGVVEGRIADGAAWRGRLRLRPGLRARRRRRRSHLRRDDRRPRSTPFSHRGRAFAAAGRRQLDPLGVDRRASVTGQRGGHQPRRSTAQVSTTSSSSHEVHALVVGHRRVDVGGAASRTRSPTSGSAAAFGGRERDVLVGAEPHRRRRRRVGLPWSMPSALSPPSATAQPPSAVDRDHGAATGAAPGGTAGRLARSACPSACRSRPGSR